MKRAFITPPPSSASGVGSYYYEPPPATSHVYHAHQDHGGSSREWSAFTKLLVRYTYNWPALRAIIADKDSRRILYFMTCVSLSLSTVGWFVQAGWPYVLSLDRQRTRTDKS